MDEEALSEVTRWWLLHGARVDRVSVEVHEAFSAAGIPCVLLKGPTIADWLYTDGGARGYGDSDFLIRRSDWDAADEVLGSRGFAPQWDDANHPGLGSFSSFPYRRDVDAVDLHATLHGLRADFTAVWAALSADLLPQRVLSAEVPALGIPGRTMLLALHAANHRRPGGKPLLDLERGLAQLTDDDWQAAAALAATLGGAATFGSGLRMLPQGEQTAERLGISRVLDAATLLSESEVPLAEGVQEMLDRPGVLAKLTFLSRELFPRPAFMRWWSPLARRGRRGLAASYVIRPVVLLSRAPAAVGAVADARRRAQSERS